MSDPAWVRALDALRDSLLRLNHWLDRLVPPEPMSFEAIERIVGAGFTLGHEDKCVCIWRQRSPYGEIEFYRDGRARPWYVNVDVGSPSEPCRSSAEALAVWRWRR